jgi:hypothetical protein
MVSQKIVNQPNADPSKPLWISQAAKAKNMQILFAQKFMLKRWKKKTVWKRWKIAG